MVPIALVYNQSTPGSLLGKKSSTLDSHESKVIRSHSRVSRIAHKGLINFVIAGDMLRENEMYFSSCLYCTMNKILPLTQCGLFENNWDKDKNSTNPKKVG